jgi:DeoR family fructose operon transcriptional repressor
VTLAGNFASEHRHEWIRARLEASGSIVIQDAAAALDVSEMTIRRDLLDLEALGFLRRVRGGAVAVGPAAFADRHRRGARAKAKLAAKLLPLVPETGAIALDASSTLLRLANAIEGARDLTVVTNGPETFESLIGKPGIRPILTGGELDPRTGSLVGPVAVRAAATFLLSKAFISAAAVDPSIGASEAALEDAEVKQVFAKVATTTVLAADHSKLGHRSLAVGLQWDEIDLFVTDLLPSEPALDDYRSKVEIS